ncbi:GGDEF domain-containing protein [Patescibacteria group bacterium]
MIAIDDVRRNLIFSKKVLDKIRSTPFDLFIEWQLEQIGRNVNVDRLAFLREGDDRELYLAKGIGPFLPIAGSRVTLPKETFRKLNSGRNNWVWTPTKKVGWDAFFTSKTPKGLVVIAIDDTTDERRFSSADEEFLRAGVEWFSAGRLLKDEFEAAKDEAKTDFLTQLPHQKQCKEEIGDLIEKIRTNGLKCGCVVLVDLDNFKHCNDSYGHLFGDSVLKNFAAQLNELNGFVGRYGGEEFLLVFPFTKEVTFSIMEEARIKFHATEFLVEDETVNASFSGGIAEITNKMNNPSVNDLFKEADSKMYSAKQAGRNRIIY